MKVVETGENDALVGVMLFDNNSVEHRINIRKRDGEVAAHRQHGYPDDPEARSMIDEVEPINHAARYAKYHVDRERGYDTVDWRREPDRILAVALTVASLDTDGIAEYFGALYDQVRNHAMDVKPPVTLPADCRLSHVSYQLDIRLGVDLDAVRSLTRRTARHNTTVGPGEPDSASEAIAAAVAEVTADGTTAPNPADFTVAAVSGVHVRWNDAAGHYHHERNDELGGDRPPDARIDCLPSTPADREEFRDHLVDTLICQVRDCYVEMGCTPPQPFRLRGIGKHRTATWYEHYGFYQRYHDPSAEIDWEIEPAEHRRS